MLDKLKQTHAAPSLRLQIGLAFFAFILIGLNDGAIGVLIPSIRTHYRIDAATVGLLFLFMTLGYLIAAFNSGLLVAKLGHRRFLLLGVTAFLVSAVVISLMLPFPLVLGILILLGSGVAILDAGLNAYIAGLPHNTALLNYLHAFYGAGALLGPLVASTILALGLGWNNVYRVWAGICLVLLAGFGLAFNSRQATPQQGAEVAPAKSNVLLTTLRMRIVWLAALFLFFYVGTEVSLGSWSYSFLITERHGPALLMGWIVSGYWAGLTLGRLTLARAARRVSEERLIEGCLAGVIVGVLLVWLVPIGGVSAVGLCLAGFSLGPIFPTTIALMAKRVSAHLLPSAVGFLTSFGSMGAAFFPWLAGNLAQGLGIWSLLPYVIVLTVVMSIFWMALQARQQPA